MTTVDDDYNSGWKLLRQTQQKEYTERQKGGKFGLEQGNF